MAAALGCLIFVGGCSLNVVDLQERREIAREREVEREIEAEKAKLASHRRDVFVTGSNLDPSEYDIVERVTVRSLWYGTSQKALDMLADEARRLGADAVVDAETWFAPWGIALAAPHGSGKAVSFRRPWKIDYTRLPGEFH